MRTESTKDITDDDIISMLAINKLMLNLIVNLVISANEIQANTENMPVTFRIDKDPTDYRVTFEELTDSESDATAIRVSLNKVSEKFLN